MAKYQSIEIADKSRIYRYAYVSLERSPTIQGVAETSGYPFNHSFLRPIFGVHFCLDKISGELIIFVLSHNFLISNDKTFYIKLN